jgi:excisionase family DNA binding protein
MSYLEPSENTLCRAFALLRASQIPKTIAPSPEYETMSPAEAAKYLKVGVRAIRKAINEKKLVAFKVGSRNWRIRVVDLNVYINKLIDEWNAVPIDKESE